MKHSPQLLSCLSQFSMQALESNVFRVTRMDADPTAPSANGGRWGVPENSGLGTRVLYTSYERDGAVAEVASYLVLLSPLPRSREIKVSRLAITLSKVVTLTIDDLADLNVDTDQYGSRDYSQTQMIGAALQYLGADALVAPSARYECNNLMVFASNHQFHEKLEVVSEEMVEWRAWARQAGMLNGLE